VPKVTWAAAFWGRCGSLSAALVRTVVQGSFDCVRLAPHSAQDDNFGEGSAIDFGLLVSVFGVDVGLVV